MFALRPWLRRFANSLTRSGGPLDGQASPSGSKVRACRPWVETLEERTLMAVSGVLAAHNDGPITAVRNVPITIDVIANDTTQNSGPLTRLGLTFEGEGSVMLNSDSTVTLLLSEVKSYLCTYTVTDGTETAVGYLYVDVVPSASELYSTYLLKVSEADQRFADEIGDAVAERATDIEAARAQAQTDAYSLYANYESAVALANQTYATAIAGVEGAYQNAVHAAQAALQANVDSAFATYSAALAAIEIVYADALIVAEQAYQVALSTADAAYDAAVGPYQTAFDQAVVDALAAEAAFASAEAELSTAVVSAASAQLASQNAALAAYQAAQAEAGMEHAAALATAVALRDAALLSADSVYAASVDPFQAARDQAYDDYLANPEDPATQTALSNAEAALSSAVAQAGTTRDAVQAAALSTYQAACEYADQSLASDQTAAAQNYQDALEEADATYATTVSPYLTARDQAASANQSAQAAVIALGAALDTAIASATTDRVAANASALSDLEAAFDEAAVVRVAEENAALTAYRVSFDAAKQASTAAAETAWTDYLDAKADADSAGAEAQSTAWHSYLGLMAALTSNLASTEAAVQSEFVSQTTEAFATWQGTEQTAWNTYAAGMLNIPGAPAWGDRVLVPVAVEIPAVEAFPGLASGAQHEFAIAPWVVPAIVALVGGAAISTYYLIGTYVNSRETNLGQRARVLAEVWTTIGNTPNIPSRRQNVMYPTDDISLLFNNCTGQNWDDREATIRLDRIAEFGAGTTVTFMRTVQLDYNISGANLSQRSGQVNFFLRFNSVATIQRPGGGAPTTRTYHIATAVGVVQDDNLRSAGNIREP